MTASAKQQVPAEYEIRVGGHLDAHWSAWFDDLKVTQESDGTTKLCGFVPDQAALYGVLTKVRDLGLVLISVEPADPADAMEPADVSSQPHNRNAGSLNAPSGARIGR